MFHAKRRRRRRRRARPRFAINPRVAAAFTSMYAKMLLVVQAVGTFCRGDVNEEDIDEEYSPTPSIIEDQPPDMIDCTDSSRQSPTISVEPMGLDDFTRHNNQTVPHNFKFSGGDDEDLSFSPTHDWIGTTFLSNKERDPSGIEIIGQKMDIAEKADTDDNPRRLNPTPIICDAPPIPIKQNFLTRAVKRFMPRKGDSPIPPIGRSPSLHSMNDSVLAWSSNDSLASITSINNANENRRKIPREPSLIMPPNKVTIDRPSGPTLDEGYGPSGSFIGMKARSTPDLNGIREHSEPKGFITDSPDGISRVRSSETFIIRKASPDISPASSVFDLDHLVRENSQTSLYGEEEVIEITPKIASSFDSLTLEEDIARDRAREKSIFAKSSDSLDALIDEVFCDAKDAILIGKEIPAADVINTPGKVKASTATGVTAGTVRPPLTNVVVRGLGDRPSSASKRVYTDKELKDLERQILKFYG